MALVCVLPLPQLCVFVAVFLPSLFWEQPTILVTFSTILGALIVNIQTGECACVGLIRMGVAKFYLLLLQKQTPD